MGILTSGHNSQLHMWSSAHGEALLCCVAPGLLTLKGMNGGLHLFPFKHSLCDLLSFVLAYSLDKLMSKWVKCYFVRFKHEVYMYVITGLHVTQRHLLCTQAAQTLKSYN